MRSSVFLSICICLFWFNLAFAERPSIDLTDDDYNVSDGVIYPKELGELITTQCSRGSYIGKYWTPTKSQIYDLESNLGNYYTLVEGINLKSIYDRFYKQYTGIYIDSKKAIYVNAMKKEVWKQDEESLRRYYDTANAKIKRKLSKYIDTEHLDKDLIDWRWWPTNACHGSKSFFGVLYFIEDKKFKDFMFNL